MKKLISYFIIMATMISGIGFLLYKNHTITLKRAAVIDMPADTILDSITISNKTEIKSEHETTASIAVPPKTSGISKILDISIFSNNKFQSLRENIVSQPVKIEMGRGNPFESY